MTISNRLSAISTKFIVAGLVVSGVFAMAVPTLTHAATYAFVNQSGNVSTVTANDWMAAIAAALNIDVHSGVLLLTNQNSGIVGSSI